MQLHKDQDDSSVDHKIGVRVSDGHKYPTLSARQVFSVIAADGVTKQ